MMKKMLVLALVLGVVGLANAGLVVNGDKVAAVNGPASAYKGWLAITEGVAFTAALQQPAAGNLAVLPAFESYGDGFVWSNFTIGGTPPTTTQAGDHILVTLSAPSALKFSTQAAGAIGQLKLYAENGETLLQTAYIVPEPMTMVLLGLGGLFLRKKK